MSQHSTSQRDINARERMNQALNLRKAGATLDQISTACGYGSRSSAHKAIKRAMAELPRENAEDLRELEAARLDELLMSYWQRAKKDTNAAHLVLRIMERRARLFGLDFEAQPQGMPQTSVIVREVPAGFFGPVDTSINEKEA